MPYRREPSHLKRVIRVKARFRREESLMSTQRLRSSSRRRLAANRNPNTSRRRPRPTRSWRSFPKSAPTRCWATWKTSSHGSGSTVQESWLIFNPGRLSIDLLQNLIRIEVPHLAGFKMQNLIFVNFTSGVVAFPNKVFVQCRLLCHRLCFNSFTHGDLKLEDLLACHTSSPYKSKARSF